MDAEKQPCLISKVYLLTTGDGSDGNEWDVKCIYSSLEIATKAKEKYESIKHYRPDGSYYTDFYNEIVEWELDD